MDQDKTPIALEIVRRNSGKKALPKNKLQPKMVKKIRCPFSRQDPNLEIPRKVWNRVAPELIRLGLLTVLDVAALVSYCQAVHLSELSFEEIKKYGACFKNEKREWKRNPAVQNFINCTNLALHLGGKFKLTSKGRAGLDIKKIQEETRELNRLLHS